MKTLRSNYLESLAAFAVGGGGVVEEFPGIKCFRSPVNYIGFNRAFVLDRKGVGVEVLRQLQRFYREGDAASWTLTVTPDMTDLLDRVMKQLRVAEWQRSPNMILRREKAAFGEAPPELKVEPAKTPAELREAMSIVTAAGNYSPGLFEGLATHETLRQPGLTVLVGRVDGKAVATSSANTAHEVAGVHLVATLKEHRGRRYGEAITAAAAKIGFSSGCRMSSLQASNVGYPVYFRLGYRHVFDFHSWVIKRDAPEVNGA
ncbi:MAG: GNAT family N-acetyltransferase [Thaumarchaeota archaeon]|nr:GNAT family N-acetyltransferase [Nitrososphaerota archaeon]